MSINCTEDYVEIDSKHGFTVESFENLNVKVKTYGVNRAPFLSMIHTMRRWILILKYCEQLDVDLKNEMRNMLENIHQKFVERLNKKKKKGSGEWYESCYYYRRGHCKLADEKCTLQNCPFYTKSLNELMEMITE